VSSEAAAGMGVALELTLMRPFNLREKAVSEN
jgi:hypothetical protein